jgi:hypothetical protein
MDKDLARNIATVAIQGCSGLVNLIPELRERCDPEDYKVYLAAIGSVTGHVNDEILTRLFSRYPDLQQEFQDRIDQHGRL